MKVMRIINEPTSASIAYGMEQQDKNKNIIQAAVDRLIESEVREMMRNNFQSLHRENGATQVSEWILSQSDSD